MKKRQSQEPWTAADILNLDRLRQRLVRGDDANVALNPSADGMLLGKPYYDNLGEFRPLGVAAYVGNIEACRLLLEAGADPDRGRQHGRSPLYEIIISRQWWRGRQAGGADIKDGDMREIFLLLKRHGANPNGHVIPAELLNADESPLYQAAYAGDHAAVKALVEISVNIDMPLVWMSPSGERSTKTALHWMMGMQDHDGSIAEPAQEMIVALLRAGANDEALGSDWHGRTPFQDSVAHGRDRIVEYYARERGEDLAQRTPSGRTLLQVAKEPSTKTLLKSLKLELAVKNAMDCQDAGDLTIATAKKGVTLL